MGSVFFDDLDFEIVKRHRIYKTVFVKADFGSTLKIFNVYVKPDGLGKIEFAAHFVEGVEDLVGTGVVAVILDRYVCKHPVVFEFSCPDTHCLALSLPCVAQHSL